MSDKSTRSLSWSDLAKKVVFAGLGGAVLAREKVAGSNLPREMITGLLSKAEKSKEDVMNLLAREVSKFLGKINVSDELSKALRGLIITLNATVDFKEKKGRGTRPHTTLHSAKVTKKT